MNDEVVPHCFDACRFGSHDL